MDNAIKAAMCFLVFCLGIAAIIFSIAWSLGRQGQQTQCPQYYVCPRCQQPYTEPPRFPNRPEIMPTPNSPYRPGNLTGDKGEKDKK